MEVQLLKALLYRARLTLLRRNEFESLALRRWFSARWQIEIGLYSYGCFDPFRIQSGSRIGKYCSFSRSSYIINANHPTNALTTHPYAYDPSFHMVEKGLETPPPCIVEDDVWVGHNAVILPGCKYIGRGAVIGAGAVVTKSVPPYAIMAGVPAIIKRYRFDTDMIAAIESSRWWELDRQELVEMNRRDQDLIKNPALKNLVRMRSERHKPDGI